jgi:hypothetical protein
MVSKWGCVEPFNQVNPTSGHCIIKYESIQAIAIKQKNLYNNIIKIKKQEEGKWQ